MPYSIVEKEKGCFGIKDIKNPSHVFSKKCQTRKQALKQRVAVVLNQTRKTGKSSKSFFV